MNYYASMAGVGVKAREKGEPQPGRARMSAAAIPLGDVGDAVWQQHLMPPLDVVVEIARFRLALGELAAVQPGEILATGVRIGERVHLHRVERLVDERAALVVAVVGREAIDPARKEPVDVSRRYKVLGLVANQVGVRDADRRD